MNRLLKILGFVTAVLAAQQLGPMFLRSHPTWTHSLTNECVWRPRRIAMVMTLEDRPLYSARSAQALYRCQSRRGLKSQTLFVKEIAQRWPSPAELAAWKEPSHGSRALP